MKQHLAPIAILFSLAVTCHADDAAFVIDDFSSAKPVGWQLSGSKTNPLIVTNHVLQASIRIGSNASPGAVWLTKPLGNVAGLQAWERLTFRFKLSATNGLAPEGSLVCRLRTSPTEFTDLPFVELRNVHAGQWQDVVIRLDSFKKPVNIYRTYFHALREFTFRFGAAQGHEVESEFSVADIRLHPKSPLDWDYEPRFAPRPARSLGKALLVTHSAAGFYFVREALEAQKVTVDRRFFRGLHFPIFDFPSADAMQDYDLVVLVDVDPYVLTRLQIESLCDFVASGGGLLFVGGPTTLGAAKAFPRPLAQLLPADFGRGDSPITVNVPVRLAASHPITSGLGPGLKRIGRAHVLAPKSGAVVALEAGARCPVLLLGNFRDGRVALVNGVPNVAEDATGDFFASAEYRTLLARTCQWLAGEAPTAQGLGGYHPTPADFPPALPFDRTTFFPIISWLGTDDGGHLLDERGLRERVDDLWNHGFNTVAIGGLTHLAKQPWSNRARLRDYAARYAQSRGMAVIFEYEHLTNIGRDKPPTPCVFAPHYREELAKQLGPRFEAARQYPRALSVKICDEPTASDKSLDHCELCQREFQKRFGRPLRKRAEISAADREGHRQLSQFIAEYVATGYEAIGQIARESGMPAGLLLTCMSPGFGYADNRRGLEEPLAWARPADFLDFDVYPYFYPVSQNIRMLQAHFCFAVQRAIAEHLRKPAGFYVELDDRNYPFQINPAEASAECAWTAVGQGCHYLNSFINTGFGTGTGARPQRWEHLGRELSRIRDAGPMLLRTRKAAAPLALYFPHAQWMSGGRPFAPAYAYQLLLRAFGECDIAHEQIVAERGSFRPVKVLVLVETDYLPEVAVARLQAFVREGGWLLCDDTVGLPSEIRNHTRVMRFPGSLDQQFRDAVETPNPEARAALLGQVKGVLAKTGISPHAIADNEDVETNVLIGEGVELLVAVNHAAAPVDAAVRLASQREPLRLRLPARAGTLVQIKK